MKDFPKILAFTALGLIALPVVTTPAAAADVGLSVSIGQPGFYGRIDVGDYPQPRVVYRQPVMIERGERADARDVVYLRVPPGHRRNWSRHCGYYDACGEQVYFVQDRWYNDVYAPQYRERHGHDRHGRRGHRGDYRSDRGNDSADRRHHNRRDRHSDNNDRRGDTGDQNNDRGGGTH